MPKSKSAIRIGTAGWTIPRAVAEELPGEGTHLERYARTINCAEINASFYRPIRISTLQKWADGVPDTFKFAVKMPKAVSHEAKLDCEAAILEKFLAEVRTLEKKLGPLLLQLPPKFEFDEKKANTFFTMMRELYDGPLVIEPRNASWFSGEANALLKEFKVARVAADPARVPKAATPGGWPGLRYWRLHGSPRMYYSAYSAEYLQTLASQINSSSGECWCIFDNTAGGAALPDALALKNLSHS